MASDETPAAVTQPRHAECNVRVWISRHCPRKPVDGCGFAYADQHGFKFRVPAGDRLAGDVVRVEFAKITCGGGVDGGRGHWHSVAGGFDGLRPRHRRWDG